MYSIVFYSATGNTKYLANYLGEKPGFHKTKIIDILEVSPQSICGGEELIIMYPIHAFNAPTEIISYIRQIKQKQFNKVHIIAIGCNTTWLNHANSTKLRAILSKKGYKVGLDRVLSMPLTMVVKFEYKIGHNIVEEAKQNIVNIADKISHGIIDEKHISIKSKAIYNIGKTEKYAAKLFGLELYANKNCVSCGVCERGCTSKNIYITKNNKPKFKLNCSMCMKCIYNCEAKAINPRLSKFLPLKNGYSLEEYI